MRASQTTIAKQNIDGRTLLGLTHTEQHALVGDAVVDQFAQETQQLCLVEFLLSEWQKQR